VILVVVNLDPYHVHSGWVDLPLEDFGITADESYQLQDLLGGGRYLWSGRRNYVELNPQTLPAHVFRVLSRAHTEQDFDGFA
jgi:starch synthase (maltosyl-transferring)